MCAARLPASRDTLLSNTRPTQPYGRVSQVTPGLEWAGHRHAAKRPIPGTPCPHLPALLRLQEAATPPSCQKSSRIRILYLLQIFLPKGMGAALLAKACGWYLVCFPCSPTSID